MVLLYIHTFEKADNQVFLLSMVLEISLSFKRFSFDIETPWQQLSDLMGLDICESEWIWIYWFHLFACLYPSPLHRGRWNYIEVGKQNLMLFTSRLLRWIMSIVHIAMWILIWSLIPNSHLNKTLQKFKLQFKLHSNCKTQPTYDEC